MDAVQFYETTVYNRDVDRAFAFVTVPVRALSLERVPGAEQAARWFDLHNPREASGAAIVVTPVEAWNLPFLLDASMRRYVDYPYEFGFYFDPLEPRRSTRGRGPSMFAQHLVFAPIVPVESSPLRNRSLSEIVSTSAGVSLALGSYAATEDPLVLIATPLLIIVCGAAEGIGQALHVGLRSLILKAMGAEDPTRPEPTSEEPSGEPPGDG
jgi:hypothetical protein